MQPHRIVSEAEWLAARTSFLTAEKKFTEARDELSRLRRELPWVKVDKPYAFTSADGRETLADLFGGRSQLIVYHFMLGPDWEQGCPSCSYLSDHFDGTAVHLAHRDVTFLVVSRAPYDQIAKFQKRMGWKFKWVSSYGSDFNFDYQVSFKAADKANGNTIYNYKRQSFPADEAPGLSVFFKDERGGVFHTYSAYARGLDILVGTYNLLDLVPKGRDEEGLAHSMSWVRHHDRYEDAAKVDPAAAYQQPKTNASCCD